MAKMGDDCIFISARERQNIDELKQLLYTRIKQLHVQKYPYNDFLFEHYEAWSYYCWQVDKLTS